MCVALAALCSMNIAGTSQRYKTSEKKRSFAMVAFLSWQTRSQPGCFVRGKSLTKSVMWRSLAYMFSNFFNSAGSRTASLMYCILFAKLISGGFTDFLPILMFTMAWGCSMVPGGTNDNVCIDYAQHGNAQLIMTFTIITRGARSTTGMNFKRAISISKSGSTIPAVAKAVTL